jgi:hypothetical protein
VGWAGNFIRADTRWLSACSRLGKLGLHGRQLASDLCADTDLRIGVSIRFSSLDFTLLNHRACIGVGFFKGIRTYAKWLQLGVSAQTVQTYGKPITTTL